MASAVLGQSEGEKFNTWTSHQEACSLTGEPWFCQNSKTKKHASVQSSKLLCQAVRTWNAPARLLRRGEVEGQLLGLTVIDMLFGYESLPLWDVTTFLRFIGDFFFFKAALLKRNLHTIQFTSFKCTFQGLLVNLQLFNHHTNLILEPTQNFCHTRMIPCTHLELFPIPPSQGHC